MRPLNADDVLTPFLEFNLGAAICGHFHGYTERWRGNTSITTGRCCARVRNNHDGTKEKGWLVCHARRPEKCSASSSNSIPELAGIFMCPLWLSHAALLRAAGFIASLPASAERHSDIIHTWGRPGENPGFLAILVHT